VIRGEIRRLKLRHQGGREQDGVRFGVILQAEALAVLSTVIVAPTSTSALPATFRPIIEIDGVLTRVLVEQLRAVDVTRLSDPVGVVTIPELAAIDDALIDVLGL